MQEEYSSIMKNNVWEVVPRTEGKSVVTFRWIYKVKHATDGSIEKFKARFHMEDYRPMLTPMITNWKKLHASDSELVDPTLCRQLIGSLMYLVNTRPDICFAVNTMSQFMCEPRKVHWVAAKHILRYLQGTVDYGLDYRQGDGVMLAGYTDSDWAGCAFDRKSTSGFCFGLGSSSVMVQPEAAVSSIEFSGRRVYGSQSS
eukprot:PITA_33941